MPSDSQYDPLFEPVGIRPLTAKSRLYQVPQATRMGYAMPQTRRNARGEGGMQLGRGVHGILLRPPKLREFVIRLRNPVRPGRCQGAGSDGRDCASAWRPRGNRTLACGPPFAKRMSRERPLSRSGLPLFFRHPVQSRAMDQEDIRSLRRWRVDAADRRLRSSGRDRARHVFRAPLRSGAGRDED